MSKKRTAMGVVHKLKPEILEFILSEKQKDPSLSCRSLSSLVQEVFDQKVSKSSINKVLKEADLSSPVGRRGLSKRTSDKERKRPFELPKQKKKELFQEASQHCILSDLKPAVEENGFIDGAGCVFLKAAEWELAGDAMLKEMLLGQNENEKAGDVARVLGFLKAFHIESLEGLSRYEGKGLWEISGVQQKITESDITEVLDKIERKDELFLKFSLKIPQIFTHTAGFRFVLRDGSSFFIDGQGVSVWKNAQKSFPISLGKATGLLAKMLNNVHSVILNSISPKEAAKVQEYRQIFDFISAFENVQSKKIQQVELVGEDGEILGAFDEAPQIKRTFIAGLWPWEGMFQRFLESKNILSEGKVDTAVVGGDISYKEASIKQELDGKIRPLRGILLFEPFMKIPFLILVTNSEAKDILTEQCIESYCRRWPNMEKGVNFSIMSDPSKWRDFLSTEKKPFLDFILNEHPQGRDPVWLVMDQFLSLLDRFCRRQFFSEIYEDAEFSTMQHRFYSLPGKIDQDEHKYVVQICSPQNFPHLRDLTFAAERLNESGIETFQKKQVSIKII